MENIISIIKNTTYRPSWDEYFVTVAYLISKRSSCDRLHVRCVLVKDNHIVSTGYNGHISGAHHESFIRDGHEQLTIHSEINAVADSVKRGVCLNNATAYITHTPCINCCKALIASGIKQIFYVEEYKKDNLIDKLCESGNVKLSHLNNIVPEKLEIEPKENTFDKPLEEGVYDTMYFRFNCY